MQHTYAHRIAHRVQRDLSQKKMPVGEEQSVPPLLKRGRRGDSEKEGECTLFTPFLEKRPKFARRGTADDGRGERWWPSVQSAIPRRCNIVREEVETSARRSQSLP